MKNEYLILKPKRTNSIDDNGRRVATYYNLEDNKILSNGRRLPLYSPQSFYFIDEKYITKSYELIYNSIQALIYHSIRYVYLPDEEFFKILEDYCHYYNFQCYSAEAVKNKLNCYSKLGGEDVELNFKIWVNCGGKIHVIEFINFQYLIGSLELEEFVKCYAPESENFCEAVLNFNYEFSRITGEALFGSKPYAYTIGGVAKKYYLKLKYPTTAPNRRLCKYQKYHTFVDEKTELNFRNLGLLKGGLLYSKPTTEGNYINNCVKIDLNSSYPDRALKAGEISRITPILPKMLNMDEIAEGEKDYIFKIDWASGVISKKYFEIINSPELSNDGKIISFNGEYYIWASLYKALQQFYKLDINIIKAWQVEFKHDLAMQEYVNKFYAIKKNCGKDAAGQAQRLIAKLLLNNLYGKFLELPYKENCRAVDWELNHFDLIRGTYIYTQARIKLLNIMAKLPEVLYSDTDSLVLRYPVFKRALNKGLLKIGDDLGEFKIEEYMQKFKAYGYKKYISILHKGEIKGTFAGLPRSAIPTFCKSLKGMGEFDTAEQIVKKIENQKEFPIIEKLRVKGLGEIKIAGVMKYDIKSKLEFLL